MFEVKDDEDREILRTLARLAPVKPFVKDFKFRHFVSKRTNLPLCGIEYFCMGTDIRAEVTCGKCRNP